MSRSNIKTFDDFKGDKYKDDIEGILVELKDKGFEFDIEYNDYPLRSYDFRISIYKWKSTYSSNYDRFKITDVDEYLKTIDAYLKIYFNLERIYYSIIIPSDVSYSTSIGQESIEIHSLDDYSGDLFYIDMVVKIKN